jgi:hypothetical protein
MPTRAEPPRSQPHAVQSNHIGKPPPSHTAPLPVPPIAHEGTPKIPRDEPRRAAPPLASPRRVCFLSLAPTSPVHAIPRRPLALLTHHGSPSHMSVTWTPMPAAACHATAIGSHPCLTPCAPRRPCAAPSHAQPRRCLPKPAMAKPSLSCAAPRRAAMHTIALPGHASAYSLPPALPKQPAPCRRTPCHKEMRQGASAFKPEVNGAPYASSLLHHPSPW